MNNTVRPTSVQSVSGEEFAQDFAHKPTRYVTGIVCCLAATVSFGLMFPVMASALTHVDPFTFTSLRYAVAAIATLILLRVMEGPSGLRTNGQPIALAWFLGSLGFAGFGFLVFLGQQLAGRDGALTASIIAATQPLLGIFISAVASRLLPPRFTILFAALSFFGVALVITKGDIGGLLNTPHNYAANGLILLGMICWLIYTFGAARFTTWSPLKYTAITMALGLTSVIAINVILVVAHVIPLPQISDLTFVIPHFLYMSLIASLAGVLCWNIGNKILTPLNGVLFTNVVPITAFTVSAFTGVLPTGVQIIGACITVAALVLNNLYARFRT